MRITFLGDIFLGNIQVNKYLEIENCLAFNNMIQGVKKTFVNSNHIVANLETPIAGDEYKCLSEKCIFNAPKQLLEEIQRSGIDILTTANNHCLDCGVEGLRNTINMIRDVGLKSVGTYINTDEEHVLWIEEEGIKIALVSYTYGTNAFNNQCYLDETNEFMVDLLQEQELKRTIDKYIINSKSLIGKIIRRIFRVLNIRQAKVPVYERITENRKTLKRLKENINSCREKGADIIIAYLHVGGQYNDKPTKMAKKYCDYCKKCGVDVVIANHEHVIHTIVNEEKFFCAFSLGNFLASTGVEEKPYDKMAEYSVAITVDVNEEGKRKFYVSLFVSSLDENRLLYCEPIIDRLTRANDLEKQKRYQDVQKLLNTIFNTTNVVYPICSEYEVTNLGRNTNTKN